MWPLANHEPFGAQGPCFANMNILVTSPKVFDGIITHPAVLPLARRLLGPEITFEEFSVTVREPIEEPQPNGVKQQAWHRDDCHLLGHPLLLRSLSVVVYLTDVLDPSGHTFSIVPAGRSGTRHRTAPCAGSWTPGATSAPKRHAYAHPWWKEVSNTATCLLCG